MPDREPLELRGETVSPVSPRNGELDIVLEGSGSAGARAGRRRDMVRNVITATIFGAAIAGAVWIFGNGAEAETSQAVTLSAKASGPSPRIGKEAPDFQVFLIDGTPARLSDFRGRPVWLSFWATWCPPCRAESPEIEQAFRDYAEGGLVVLAIDVGEDPRTVQSYVQKAGLTYAIGLDQGTQIGALYHVAGLPNHFFIDVDGVLRDSRAGRMGRDSIGKSIATILQAGAPAQSAVTKPAEN